MKRWNVLAAAILAASILTGSGCATRTVYVDPKPLPLPERPELPRLAQNEFVPLGDPKRCGQGEKADCLFVVHLGTVIKMVERDAKRKAYAEELEAIIQATRED